MRRSGLLAALCIAVLLTSCSRSPNQRPATATTHATSTTTSSTISTIQATTTTTLVLARPCTAADLGIGGIDGGAATGHIFTHIRVRNLSSTICSLSDYPTSLTATSLTGEPLGHYDRGTFRDDPRPGNLEPGFWGMVVIETSNVCSDGQGNPPTKQYKDIHIGLPGGGGLSLGDVTIDGTCYLKISRFGLEDE